MERTKIRNIQNRNGNLYFRIKIPDDCRESLGGKNEVVKTLKLRKHQMKEAGEISHQLAVEWKDTFRTIREKSRGSKRAAPPPFGQPLDKIIRGQVIHRNAELLLNKLINFQGLESCRKTLFSIKKSHELLSALFNKDKLHKSVLLEVNTLSLLGTYDVNSPTLRTQLMLDPHAFPHPGKTSHTMWSFAVSLKVHDQQRALRTIIRILIEELQYLANEIVMVFPQLNMVEQWSKVITLRVCGPYEHQPDAVESVSIASVLDECIAIKKRSPKMQEGIRKETIRFLEWHDLDSLSTPINKISVSQMIDYRDNCLKHLPLNANRRKQTENLPLKLQIEKGKRNGWPTISTTTLNNRLTCLGIVFGYAKRRLYVDIAVNEGLHLEDERKQAKLLGLVYSGYSDKQMGNLIEYLEIYKNKHRKGYEWRYWIPLLLAYSGCRANEIAMLTIDDVKQESGIWYLDLRNDEAKRQRVKNLVSIRRVPICKKVLDAGFVKHVESIASSNKQKNNPEGRLWKSLTYHETSKWVRRLSHYFNKTVRPAIHATDIHSGLHGLRSSVCRALQRRGVEQRAIDELIGHQPEGISRIALGYQGRLDIEILAKAVDEINWNN